MLGSRDKPFGLTLWWERENHEHEELPSSGEAMQTELNLEDKPLLEESGRTTEDAEKVQSMRTVALMALMGLIRKLEPELKLKEKLLLTEPEPDLKLKEKLLLTEPVPDLKLKEKLLLTEPVSDLKLKEKLLLTEPVSDLKLKEKLLLTEPVPDLKLKEKLLLTQPERDVKMKEKLLLAEPEREFIFKKKGLVQKPVPTLADKMLQVEIVTDTDMDTEEEPELTLAENALQMELVTDTDTDTETETESDTETEPELTLEEMLQEVEPDPELTMEEKVLQGLHLTYCKEFTEYDPRKNAFVSTRFCGFNIAFFDLDEESEAISGPPLQELNNSQWRSIVGSSVNVISLKILESDDGYPIDVFGTVIARDEVDYKCVYLFKRGRGDPQHICSANDMLMLTGPCRGFAVSDRMFFEINLKIKGDDITKDRDFSKGVIEHCRVPLAKRPVTELLSSWLSTVELVYTPVPFPVAATIKVNILDGPCDVPFNGKITAWTTGNAESCIILYEYDSNRMTGGYSLIDDGGAVALTRKLIAVPVPVPTFDDDDEQIVVNVCFITSNGENEKTQVALQYPEEEKVCNHGLYQLEVKVDWTAIFSRPMSKDIHRRWCSVPRKLFRLGC